MLCVMPGTEALFVACVLKVRESYEQSRVDEVIKTWSCLSLCYAFYFWICYFSERMCMS